LQAEKEQPVLTSLVITLHTERPLKLPPHLGRAAHAALLRLIAQADPALAEQLHAPDERRPFTCSTLWGPRQQAGSLVLEPGPPAFLRYTGLTEAVSSHLQRLAESPPEQIDIEGAGLQVRQATLDPAVHPWAGQAGYEDLAGRHLLPRGTPAPRVELEFASPTAFRSAGRTVPLPLPGLVYGSLVEKWNAFSPVAVSEEVRRFAEECLAVSRYRLSTQPVAGKEEGLQIGFLGVCRYAALNRDRYWLAVVQLLSDYAFYAGVGYQTAVGLGQVRRAPPRVSRGRGTEEE
jgi:CRISPR-associated endoribonuclease Cas6